MILPVLISWTNPEQPVNFIRWWAFLLLAGITAIVGGGINYSLPRTPPMTLNSITFGFAGASVVEIIRNIDTA